MNNGIAVILSCEIEATANQTWTVGTGGSLLVNTISGTRNLTLAGGGTARVGSSSALSGTLSVANGTWRISDSGDLGSPSVINLGSAGAVGTFEKLSTSAVSVNTQTSLVSGGTGSIYASGGTLTWAGGISGSGALLARTTAGSTLLITGTNSHLGETQVQGSGTTRISGGSAIADNAALAVSGGAVLDLADHETVGSLAGSGSVSLNARRLTVAGSQSGTFSGVILGSEGLSRTGSGTLVLQSANSYSGSTSVTGGVLVARHAGALGNTSAATYVSGTGALELAGGVTVTDEALFLSGSGAGGSGALRSSGGSNVYAGAITLSGNSTISAASGTLQLDVASGNSVAGSADLRFDGAGAIRVNDSISLGSGGVAKQGAGSVWFSTSNSYSGLTQIDEGTLRVLHSAALGSSAGASTVAAGGALELSGDLQIGDQLQLAGSGVAQGGALRSLSGTSTVTGTVLMTADARINADAGALILDATSGGGPSGSSILTFGGAGTIIVMDDMSLGTGGIRKDGAGTLELRGNNSFSGSNVFQAGVVSLKNAAALGSGTAGTLTVVESGASLEISGGISMLGELLALSGSGAGGAGALRNVSGTNFWTGNITVNSPASIVSDSGLLTLNVTSGDAVTGTSSLVVGGAGNVTIADAVSLGAGDLVKSGAGVVTLLSDNAYGGTTIVSGSLQVGNGGGAGSLGSGPVVNDGTLVSNRTGSSSIASDISGAGSLIKRASGTLSLGGSNSFSGSTAVIGGVLRVASDGGLGNTVGSTTVNDGATLELANGITVGAEALNLGGGGVTGGGALRSTSGTNTYGGTITLTSGARINTTAGLLILDVAAGNAIAGNFDVTFGGSADTRILDPIAIGSASLVKNGAGSVWLGANNSYTGTTAVNAGALRILADNALGSNSGATVVASGASLEFQGNLGVAESITLSGAGVSSTGAIRNISGTSTLSSQVTLSGSSRIASDAGELIFDVAGGEAISGAFDLIVSGSGSVVIADALGLGAATLTKAGSGSLSLSGSSSFSGATAVNAGTLKVLHAHALGSAAGATTVASGAALEIVASDVNPIFLGESLAVSGQGVNSGGALRHVSGFSLLSSTVTLNADSRIRSDAGVLILDSASGPSVSGTYSLVVSGSGGVVMSDGISLGTGSLTKEGSGGLQIRGSSTYGNTVISGGVLQIGDGFAATTLGTGSIVNNAALFILPAGDMSAANAISGSGSFEKGGDGRLILLGNNSYEGSTLVGQGVLRIAHANALGSIAAGTVVDFGSAMEISGGITVGAEALSLDGSGISQGGALRNTSGVNTYGGNITLAGSTRINSDGGLLRLDVASGASISGNAGVTFGGAGNINVVDAIATGTHGVIKDGAGILTLVGENTYSGSTIVNEGTLIVGGRIAGDVQLAAGTGLRGNGVIAGSVLVGGTHAPGNSAPGVQTFESDLEYLASAVVAWELIANTDSAGARGSSYDGINTGGALLLGDEDVAFSALFSGTVNWNDSFWETDHEWVVYNVTGGGSVSGRFAPDVVVGNDAFGNSFDSMRGASGANFSLAYDADQIVLQYNAIPEPSVTMGLGAALLVFAALAGRRKPRARG